MATSPASDRKQERPHRVLVYDHFYSLFLQSNQIKIYKQYV